MDIPIHVFGKYTNVTVLDKKQLTDETCREHPTYFPTNKATVNCTGSNLVDLGFQYYANKQAAPEYHKNYVKFHSFLDLHFFPQFKTFLQMQMKYKYVVLTPYYSHTNRRMTPKLFNFVKDHLVSRGIVPVLLGQESWAERRVNMDKEYDFSKCVNLLNKTTLLQAGAVIKDAEMVIGVDNGLLHLAGMTETPIIYGYTIIGPEHRRPRRDVGTVIDIYPHPKELKCTFCLSQMRYHFGHDFNKCIYKDDMCTKALEDPRPWVKAITEIMMESKDGKSKTKVPTIRRKEADDRDMGSTSI